MRVIVLGAGGMLGHKIFQLLSQHFETWGTFQLPAAIAHQHPAFVDTPEDRILGGVDAFNGDSLVRAVAGCRPEVLVNCVGLVNQLCGPNDVVNALTVNALLPHRLAELASVLDARLIHISTDGVFSGAKGAYIESDVPDATDLYGRIKLIGEVARPGCLTLRTSIVGRDLAKSTGLLEWFLKQRGRRVQGYRKVVFSAFPTRSLARIIGNVIECHSELAGVYHVASKPITKYDFLLGLRAALNVDVDIQAVDGVSCDRSLDGSRFNMATGHQVPAWPELFADLADDPTPYDVWRQHQPVT
jgi:dTDP-4-dehydrorhamnose reductase